MKVILSKQTLSLTGMLKPELGYFLVPRRGSFYSVRSKYGAPPDGHWRFIVLCAELAQNKLHITDIEVSGKELREALTEAGLSSLCSRDVRREVFSAADILSLSMSIASEYHSDIKKGAAL